MSDIEFYIPKNETIPTNLRLIVDGIFVTYERINSGFRFDIFTDDELMAMSVAEKIVNRIMNEHDESGHGVSWRTVSLEIDHRCEFAFGIYTIVIWKYRVRDSY